jgi:hypothetical protein
MIGGLVDDSEIGAGPREKVHPHLSRLVEARCAMFLPDLELELLLTFPQGRPVTTLLFPVICIFSGQHADFTDCEH